jgi:hypothetical protein
MKATTLNRPHLWLWFLLVAGNGIAAEPLSTAFVYQGRLSERGSGASGTYDFTFTLWDAATNGTALAPACTAGNVAVTGGLFTATLDFGREVLAGQARWLEVSVRTNGGAGYTSLHPRHPITPAPYALYALQAGTASVTNLAGTYGGIVSFSNPANRFTCNGAGLAGVDARPTVSPATALDLPVSMLLPSKDFPRPIFGGWTATAARFRD